MKELKDYFVSQEQAESLKELGFKYSCLACYTENGELAFRPSFHHTETSAPLIAQALDWLANELKTSINSVNINNIDDCIEKLKTLRKRINVTVSLIFEVFQSSKTYEDGYYLVINNHSTYPQSIQILYGECIGDDGLELDNKEIEFISPSFEIIHE
jgi:hypothetical protein